MEEIVIIKEETQDEVDDISDCDADYDVEPQGTVALIGDNNRMYEDSHYRHTAICSGVCNQNSSSPSPCKVCGDSATGMYFGALVCVPCKTFFLRYGVDGHSFECKFDKNCPITPATRTQCKYCRFNKCTAAGMARKFRPTQVQLHEGQQLCVVCNDLANGVHFGALTCEGCKKFFRRGLQEHKQYVCKNEMCCQINPRTRNSCRYCRYQKCVINGMSREAIQMGRPSKIRNLVPICNGNSGSSSNVSVHGSGTQKEFLGPSVVVQPEMMDDFLQYYNIRRQSGQGIAGLDLKTMSEKAADHIANTVYGCQPKMLCESNRMTSFDHGENGRLSKVFGQFSEQLSQEFMDSFSRNRISGNCTGNRFISASGMDYNASTASGGPATVSHIGVAGSLPSDVEMGQASSMSIRDRCKSFDGSIKRSYTQFEQELPAKLGDKCGKISKTANAMCRSNPTLVDPWKRSRHESCTVPSEVNVGCVKIGRSGSDAAILANRDFRASVQQPREENHIAELQFADGNVSSDVTNQILTPGPSSTDMSPLQVSPNSLTSSPKSRPTDRDSPYNFVMAMVDNCDLFKEASKNPLVKSSENNDVDLQKFMDNNEQNQITKHYWLRTDQLPDENVIFINKHLEIINQITAAYDKFVQTGTNINVTLKKELESWNMQNSEPLQGSLSLPEWIQLKVVPVYTFSSITYCKSLPGFTDLAIGDQATLVRLGQSQSRIMVAAIHWYNPELNDFDNFLSWRPMDLFKKRLITFAEKIHNLHLDHTESALLNSLIIIASDYPGIQKPRLIEEIRQNILSTFRAYTTAMYGTPNGRLELLFSHIPETRELGFLHYKMTMLVSLRAEEVHHRQ